MFSPVAPSSPPPCIWWWWWRRGCCGRGCPDEEGFAQPKRLEEELALIRPPSPVLPSARARSGVDGVETDPKEHTLAALALLTLEKDALAPRPTGAELLLGEEE